jgi:ABC-2 type transport system permease protein
MSVTHEHAPLWRTQTHAALVVAKKDMRIYYLKPPVLIFGVIFPVFFFLAFTVGRPVALDAMVPGMLAMALFFTASAVGPLVTPWERQAKTYERLVTSPASFEAILCGDILAGTAFGVMFAFVPLILGLVVTDAQVVFPERIVLGVTLGALAFASLGVLLSAPATDSPSQIMMLSNLVRLPLIFVSGVFIPISEMPRWGRWIAPLSPLSYCVDLIRAGYGEALHFGLWVDVVALVAFLGLFSLGARHFHRRSRRKAQ